MFGWLKRRSQDKSDSSEPMVTVFLSPLAMLLAGAERQKGAPLTEAEVIAVRDDAESIQMSKSKAELFYAVLDAQAPVPRIDPDRVWEDWQAIREQIRLAPNES